MFATDQKINNNLENIQLARLIFSQVLVPIVFAIPVSIVLAQNKLIPYSLLTPPFLPNSPSLHLSDPFSFRFPWIFLSVILFLLHFPFYRTFPAQGYWLILHKVKHSYGASLRMPGYLGHA